MEYDGAARSFADMLEADLERSTDIVGRMIDALDDYLRINPPETAPARPAGLGSGGSAPVPSAPATAPPAETPAPPTEVPR